MGLIRVLKSQKDCYSIVHQRKVSAIRFQFLKIFYSNEFVFQEILLYENCKILISFETRVKYPTSRFHFLLALNESRIILPRYFCFLLLLRLYTCCQIVCFKSTSIWDIK